MKAFFLILLVLLLYAGLKKPKKRYRNNYNKKKYYNNKFKTKFKEVFQFYDPPTQEYEYNNYETEKDYRLDYYPYKKRYLLTNNEYFFYKKLKEVAERYGLRVLTKVRLADIIEVDRTKINQPDYTFYYNRIQSKHIDFLVCKGDGLEILTAIELDDNSHNNPERQKSDEFKNNALRIAGISLIRCKGPSNIEGIIRTLVPEQQIQYQYQQGQYVDVQQYAKYR